MRFSFIVLALLLLPFVNALVVVNSLDGRDVLSAAYYANVANDTLVFVPPQYNLDLLLAKIGTGNDIFLIESKEHPIVVGLAGYINDTNNVTLFISKEPMESNLELARMSEAQGFAVIDSTYGYAAVSLLPYAKLKGLYLLFANDTNGGELASFLQSHPGEVLLYGYIPPSVVEALDKAGISYDRIDTHDKYADNIEIVRRYFSLNPSKKQVILSDGNALESTIAQGDTPVLLIGPIVPDITYDFLKEMVAKGQVRVLLVVDKTNIPAAANIKERLAEEVGKGKVSLIAKFGLGISSSPGVVYPVELFPLPGPKLGLNITNVSYNPDAETLEVAYENTGNVPEYVRPVIRVYVDGNYYTTLGDRDAFLVNRGEVVGKLYPLSIEEGEISVNITAYFGESPHSMDRMINVALPVARVAFKDKSELAISSIYEEGHTLSILYENTGPVPLYFKPYIYSSEGKKVEGEVDVLSPGEGKIIRLPKLEGELTVGAVYGAREGFLGKRVEKAYVPPFPWWILILLLLLLLLLWLWTKRREKEEEPPKKGKGRSKAKKQKGAPVSKKKKVGRRRRK